MLISTTESISMVSSSHGCILVGDEAGGGQLVWQQLPPMKLTSAKTKFISPIPKLLYDRSNRRCAVTTIAQSKDAKGIAPTYMWQLRHVSVHTLTSVWDSVSLHTCVTYYIYELLHRWWWGYMGQLVWQAIFPDKIDVCGNKACFTHTKVAVWQE